MKNKLLELINEQESPLFRIMAVHNENDPTKRSFDNNICAFHVGNGHILSVAHNLRLEAKLFKSIDEGDFQNKILNNCDTDEQQLLNKCYILNQQTNKRYINIRDKNDIQPLIDTLKKINFDTRWITFYKKSICKPFLIVQFKNKQFYDDSAITAAFDQRKVFSEPALGQNTFLVELELIRAYYSEDIALYKIINTDQRIIDKIPSVDISYEIIETGNFLFCAQSSPMSNLGRMINESRIEGILNHHAIQPDRIGGNYFREGLRYLLKGYFRFGSSGAPYFVYDKENDSFKANAIQSEASPIQLAINNSRKGNFQYVNAIASPLKIIEDSLKSIIDQTR